MPKIRLSRQRSKMESVKTETEMIKMDREIIKMDREIIRLTVLQMNTRIIQFFWNIVPLQEFQVNCYLLHFFHKLTWEKRPKILIQEKSQIDLHPRLRRTRLIFFAVFREISRTLSQLFLCQIRDILVQKTLSFLTWAREIQPQYRDRHLAKQQMAQNFESSVKLSFCTKTPQIWQIRLPSYYLCLLDIVFQQISTFVEDSVAVVYGLRGI